MQSTNSSMNFPLQLEGVLSQTGRENRVLCCLLAFTEVRRPSFLTRPARPPGFSFGSSVQPIVPSKLGGALGLRWRTATAISSK